jgi:ribosomal protein L35
LSKHTTKKKRQARGTSNLEGANLKVVNKLLEA